MKKTVRIGSALAENGTRDLINRRHFSQYAQFIPVSSCFIYIHGISVMSDER
jgi:hypothetical protein